MQIIQSNVQKYKYLDGKLQQPKKTKLFWNSGVNRFALLSCYLVIPLLQFCSRVSFVVVSSPIPLIPGHSFLLYVILQVFWGHLERAEINICVQCPMLKTISIFMCSSDPVTSWLHTLRAFLHPQIKRTKSLIEHKRASINGHFVSFFPFFVCLFKLLARWIAISVPNLEASAQSFFPGCIKHTMNMSSQSMVNFHSFLGEQLNCFFNPRKQFQVNNHCFLLQ